jgi:hypothetical protein
MQRYGRPACPSSSVCLKGVKLRNQLAEPTLRFAPHGDYRPVTPSAVAQIGWHETERLCKRGVGLGGG